MADEGDARANTIGRIPMRFRRPLVRPPISEQPPSTSLSPASTVSVRKKRRRIEDLVFDDDYSDDDFQARVDAAPPAGDVRVSKTAVSNVTVGDADALDCGVCFLALRSPIFQCEVGHVVCSACRDRLLATGNGNCHVCRGATRGYRRCHAMERLVDCIRVPCPHAAHGCDATTPYHDQESHRQVCLHAPCHCPGAWPGTGTGGGCCGFIGSTAALINHLAGSSHNWPCTTRSGSVQHPPFRLHDGFNFLVLDNQDVNQSAANCSGVPCRLFLLNMTQERLGRAISVLSIHPHTSTAATQCELIFSQGSHYQSSVFSVVCTDLSNGLPNHEGCFQFFVPNAILGLGDNKSSIQVQARIIN